MGQTNDKPGKAAPKRENGAKAARFDSSRFVQYELDSAQTAACKAWNISSDDLWTHLVAMADDGYSVTFKFDSWSDCYACFVQVRGDDTHVNAGLVLTGRGSVPAKAFKQAIFKMDAIGTSWVQYGERRQVVLDD